MEEVPKIEKLTKMFPLTPEKKTVDFTAIAKDVYEIAKADNKEGFHTLGEVLKDWFPDETDDADRTKQAQLARAAVLARAVTNGYNVELVHPGDKFDIDEGYLWIFQAEGANYAIPLVDKPNQSVVNKWNQEHTDPVEQYMIVSKREDVKETTRRAWEKLEEVFDTGVLYDVMAALGIKFTLKNRQEIWDEMNGTELLEKLQGHQQLKNITADFLEQKYTGTALQNVAMVEYLRMQQESKEPAAEEEEEEETTPPEGLPTQPPAEAPGEPPR